LLALPLAGGTLRGKDLKSADDPFKILGVAPGADDRTVKRAYRLLAKSFHPDLNSSSRQAETRFKQIQSAYEAILCNRRQASTTREAQHPVRPPHPHVQPEGDSFFFFYRAMKARFTK
jgi:curved DNA-binding protein CbpA